MTPTLNKVQESMSRLMVIFHVPQSVLVEKYLDIQILG